MLIHAKVSLFPLWATKEAAPFKLISDNLGKGENTRTLISLSDVPAWYSKTKATYFLKIDVSEISFKWAETWTSANIVIMIRMNKK